MDKIEFLIDQAHRLFSKTSIYEVYDIRNRQEIIKTLVEAYGPVDVGKVDRYLSILDRLRHEIGECEVRNAK